jgi:hypothetical protein
MGAINRQVRRVVPQAPQHWMAAGQLGKVRDQHDGLSGSRGAIASTPLD